MGGKFLVSDLHLDGNHGVRFSSAALVLGHIAQWSERSPHKGLVPGSSPGVPTPRKRTSVPRKVTSGTLRNVCEIRVLTQQLLRNVATACLL